MDFSYGYDANNSFRSSGSFGNLNVVSSGKLSALPTCYPIALDKNNVLLPCRDGCLHQVGFSDHWIIPTVRGNTFIPVAVSNRIIFYLAQSGYLVAQTNDSHLIWERKIAFASCSAVKATKDVVSVSTSQGVILLESLTGRVIVSDTHSGGLTPEGPILDENRHAYCTTADGQIICINAEGRLWETMSSNSFLQGLVQRRDHLLVTAKAGTLLIIDKADGTVVASRYDLPPTTSSALYLSDDRVVYAGMNGDITIYSPGLDEVLHRASLGKAILYPLALDADDNIIVLLKDGTTYCFDRSLDPISGPIQSSGRGHTAFSVVKDYLFMIAADGTYDWCSLEK